MIKHLRLLALSLILIGCDAITGKEVGRLQINDVSSEGNVVIKEISLDLKKDDEVAIWSEMDLEYEGDVALKFKLEIWKDGVKKGELELDPREKNITIGEVRTTVMDKTTWSFSGKNSEITIDDSGKYTFKGILVASENPSLKVTKAELLFKI